MTRILTVLALAVGMAGHAAGESVLHEDVTYRNGAFELAAEFIVPAGATPRPAVVIAQGSGASDRSNQWSRDISALFVEHGVAVLLTDKRGAGASAGDWRTAGFQDLAGDVLAGVDFLVRRVEVDPERIGLVGLSQGGQVVPIAAARSPQVAFVVSVSSKAVGFAEGSFLEMGNTARQAGLAAPDIDRVIDLNFAAVRFVTQGEWERYAQLREEMLVGPTAELAAGFPKTRDATIWAFIRSVALYDPLPWWLQVRQPALIVYGEDDEQDNSPVAESIRRLRHVFSAVGKRNATIRVIPGVGHGLRDPANHELADPFREVLGQWLRTVIH